MQTRGKRSGSGSHELQRKLRYTTLGLGCKHHFRTRELHLQCSTRRALVRVDERHCRRRRPNNFILLSASNFNDVKALVARRDHATLAVRLLVLLAVTVVVHVVADIRFVRVDVAFCVIAVTFLARCRGQEWHAVVAEAVHVVVAAFICVAVAIVVCAVAEFRCHGERGFVGIITVLVVLGIAARKRAHPNRLGGVTVSVAVCVFVKGGLDAFVRLAVTVVVFFVAGFTVRHRRRGADCSRAVDQALNLAIGANASSASFAQLLGAAVVILDCVALVHLSVTIVVHAVALFRCTRVNRVVAVVAVAIDLNDVSIEWATLERSGSAAVGVAISVFEEDRLWFHSVVDNAVAVVVLAVARFTGGIATRRANGGQIVDRALNFAVCADARSTGIVQVFDAIVIILEREAFVGLTVAVVVDAIASLFRAWERRFLLVVAVAVLGHVRLALCTAARGGSSSVAVAVFVRVVRSAALRVHFVSLTVTIVVDAIAGFCKCVCHVVCDDRTGTRSVRTSRSSLLGTHAVTGRA